MLKLVISDDEGKTMVIPLTRDELTIGRKDGNSIRLTERNVSRRHARIVKRAEGFFLEDLASYNGIVINGARLAESKPMRGGDQILIGDYKLQVVEEAGNQPTPPPPAPPPVASEHAAPLLAATPSSAPANGAPGLAALNDPLAPPAAAAGPVPEHIRGMRVVFLAPAGVPAPVMLDRLPMILGRSESADIALAFSSISREHARLFVEDDKLFIEDMGSSNGVQVNGEKHRKSELAAGDMVQLGVVEFRVARRGDSTVVIQRAAADEKAAAGKSNKGLIAGVVFGGVCLGLAVLLVVSKGSSPTNPQPEAPAQTPPAPAIVAPAVAAPAPAAEPPAATPEAATAPVAAPATPEPTPAAPEPTPAPALPVAAPVAPEPTPPAPEPAAPPAAEPEHVVAQTVNPANARHPDRHARTTPPAAPAPRTPAPTPAPAPRPAAPTPAATAMPIPEGATPMDQARACLRNNSSNMAAGNQCVVQVLRGRASTESELGLLAVTYRTMGRSSDATRAMRTYIQRYPDGPRVPGFQQYIDNNSN
ncbi:MAG: FHA domain-containing protein [Myxococcales bacterium]|nr:FHA domain-containing protein [Myxococcales bacterium]